MAACRPMPPPPRLSSSPRPPSDRRLAAVFPTPPPQQQQQQRPAAGTAAATDGRRAEAAATDTLTLTPCEWRAPSDLDNGHGLHGSVFAWGILINFDQILSNLTPIFRACAY